MKLFKQAVRPAVRALVCGGAVALLAACGGGGGQVEPFKPQRVIVLGDETSLLTADGKKYGINGFLAQTDINKPDVIDCRVNPLWVQTVASGFGLVFPQCNPDKVVNPGGVMSAKLGAKVADLAAEIDARMAAGGFNSKDLVTVLVGVHDVLDLYQQYPAQSQAALLSQAEQRGQALANQINRVVASGGRTVFVLIPDVGLSPFALAEAKAKPVAAPDQARDAFISALVARFNSKLRLGVTNDGRFAALINGVETTQQMVKFPSLYGLSNVTQAACSVALPDCTPKTMVSVPGTNGGAPTAANPLNWMWADALHLAPAVHTRIGSTALQAASIHPF